MIRSRLSPKQVARFIESRKAGLTLPLLLFPADCQVAQCFMAYLPRGSKGLT